VEQFWPASKEHAGTEDDVSGAAAAESDPEGAPVRDPAAVVTARSDIGIDGP
jgi:hypothetical protein